MDLALAIAGAKLIDGTNSPPISSSVVLIGPDGRIAAVGSQPHVPIPDGIPTVQATGMTLLPGLIDGHVHLTWDKTLYFTSRSHLGSVNVRVPGIPVPTPKK